MMGADTAEERAGSNWRYILAGAVLLLAITLAALWLQRAPLAENFLARELAKRNVLARYDLVQVGLRTQRIENLVLGDPRHPDLTARWVEVDLAYGGIIPSVGNIRASGVRLNGRLRDGRLSLGELDKFRDPASTEPFALPDIRLSLSDARLALATDYGDLRADLSGDGNLQSGFDGRARIAMAKLALPSCAVLDIRGDLRLRTTDAQPGVAGPLSANALGCRQARVGIARPTADIDLLLGKALDRWRGSLRLRAQAIRIADVVAAAPNARIDFTGDEGRTSGDAHILAGGTKVSPVTAAGFDAGFRYEVATGERLAARASGTLAISNLGERSGDPAAALRRAARGTPLDPIAVKLADAIRAAARDNVFRTEFALNQRGDRGSLALARARLVSRSGAELIQSDGGTLSVAWPDFAWSVKGGLRVQGGGLPQAALSLSPGAGGRGWSGQLFLSDYAAPGARLSVPAIRFVAARDGSTRFTLTPRLDGPLPGGAVQGLSVPIDGQFTRAGALVLTDDCRPLAFQSLALSGVRFGASRLTLCGGLVQSRAGLSGALRLRQPRLAGRAGSSPLRLAAESARFDLQSAGFGVSGLDVVLGQPASPVRIQVADLSGAATGQGLGGRFAGGGARIGAVPLIVSDSAGDWGFARGALKLRGGLQVADSARPVRFAALDSRDFTLLFNGNSITANGDLLAPASGTRVLHADILHRLDSGAGHADLIVDGITFGKAIQPSDLTPLALGVVANVEGRLQGRGRIDWTSKGVTSNGIFSTQDANLAAAFGPVTGLSGEIHFTDLLGLVTAPHQRLRLGAINPGIPVKDGFIDYQLVPGNRVAIERGEWPFAAGRLLLDPALIDFAAQVPRRLTLRVDGISAAAFLQEFDFENINATGTFDGILPLVFDANGGRIENGRLSVRESGGSIAYVGELTEKDLGQWGNYAFQSLKSLRYRTLGIVLNGNLDGEIITQIDFTGLSQGEGAKANFITRKIAALPIHFNVTIRAPFRQLIFSARSFYDPSLLIEQNLPQLIQEQERRRANPVQPKESDPVR